MSEEVKIKISQPMFEVGELERFDNNIHSIVEEYSKMLLHEKDQILTQRIIVKQEEEIERLQRLVTTYDELLLRQNNKVDMLHSIIKEVREYIEDLYDVRFTDKDKRKILEILDKENNNE